MDNMCFQNSVRTRLFWCVLLGLLLLRYAAGQISFTSQYRGKTVTGLVGSSVNFTWSFTGDVIVVNWGLKEDGGNNFESSGILVNVFKVGTVTMPDNQPAYTGRISVSGNVSFGQVIFTLNPIKTSDERFYGCKISPTDFDSVYLAVKEVPQINISSVQARYNEGSSFNISCTASGIPDPDVKWIRNGTVISLAENGTILVFSSVNRADDGLYTCTANNSVGNDEKHVTLVVHYKPEGTTLTTSAAGNIVTQGGNVTFTCQVTGAKPQVTQYKFYVNNTLVKNRNDSQYAIYNVQRSQHYGVYKCVPHNDVGDGPEAIVILNFKAPAWIPVLPPNVTVNETNYIVVSCDASGFPAPSVTWTKNGQVVSRTKQLKIHCSSRSDTGVYVCTASNGVGQDKTANVYVIVQYPPKIQQAATSAAKSWIGQTVTLKCVSDGVPTPTLTWYKPDGSQINSVTATQNIVNVEMKGDQDFGEYKCGADNGITPAAYKIVEIQQIREPGSPAIISSASDIQATSLTVKWTAPSDDGGSPITAYRVVILKTGTEIKNENVTDPDTTSLSVGGLERDNVYMVKVFARNAVFEGPAGEKEVKTKIEGVPIAATINDLPSEVTDDTITLKWSEPEDNGKVITQYTVYVRILSDGKTKPWNKLNTITDTSVRELKVNLERGKEYEFVVTATNDLGESLKEEGKIMRVKVSGVVPTLAPVISKKSNSKVTVVEGNPLYLVCEAEGSPSPKVIWSKNGDLLPKNTNKTEFIVDSSSKEDAGNYECKVSNSLDTVSYTMEVAIKGEDSTCKETMLHIVYSIVIFLLLLIIIILVIRDRKAKSNTNRRVHPASGDICTECGRDRTSMNLLPAREPEQHSNDAERSGDSTNFAIPDSEDNMPLLPSGQSRTVEPTQPSSSALTSGDPTVTSRGNYKLLHASEQSWEIDREQVKNTEVIGKGAFSNVARATAWNLYGNEKNTAVAVKILKANAPDSDRQSLLAELELMKKLKPHPHMHVIQLLGCVTETDPLLVLIEYVPFGDLLGYLRKSRELKDTYFKDPDMKPQSSLTSEQLMRFAWQVADAMLYLSSKKIIHGDLAARNVLVGEGERCKVTDFGMARNVRQDDIYTKRNRGRLLVKWTALEALLNGIYTTKSDVWSYGVLLYEILTVGGSPYPGINGRQLVSKLQGGYRMPKPSHVDDKLYQTMLRCWEENPSNRPTFAALEDTMKDMSKDHMTYVDLAQYENSLYTDVEDLAHS